MQSNPQCPDYLLLMARWALSDYLFLAYPHNQERDRERLRLHQSRPIVGNKVTQTTSLNEALSISGALKSLIKNYINTLTQIHCLNKIKMHHYHIPKRFLNI